MLPRVIIHNTVSVDGRMDWFEPDIGLYYQIATGFDEDAMLSGSNTILAMPTEEEPEEGDETAEPPEAGADGPRRLLVVVDSRGRVRNWPFLRKQPYWRGVVALCSRSTSRSHLEYLEREQVTYIVTGGEHVDLRAALEELNVRYGVQKVRVDSGGILNGLLLRAGLVDEVSVLIDPSLVGGTSPRSLFTAPDLRSSEGVMPLKLEHLERFEGDVVWLRYEVIK
jgi:2,5-diamino-6-(ribosylamino)-4(3H)-pyrimidinone 5'-phosphate reductase